MMNAAVKITDNPAKKRNTRFFHMLIPTFSPSGYARRCVNMQNICMNIRSFARVWRNPAIIIQKSPVLAVYGV